MSPINCPPCHLWKNEKIALLAPFVAVTTVRRIRKNQRNLSILLTVEQKKVFLGITNNREYYRAIRYMEKYFNKVNSCINDTSLGRMADLNL